jgi:hypothetical protein
MGSQPEIVQILKTDRRVHGAVVVAGVLLVAHFLWLRKALALRYLSLARALVSAVSISR